MSKQNPIKLDASSKICVFGAGSWGTAMAVVFAEQGFDVSLLGRDREKMAKMQKKRCNDFYLPKAKFPQNLKALSDPSIIESVDLLVVVVPSDKLRNALGDIRPKLKLKKHAVILSCCKGIELGSGLRMSQLISEIYPEHPVTVLAGPSHAEEVALRMPTVVVINANDLLLARKMQAMFRSDWFRAYVGDDLVGAELAGAAKNVFAIASGACNGLELGDNARAGLVSRGLAEMIRLGEQLGGKRETFMGLSGVGDLLATCYSEHSRNFRLGRLLGRGMSLSRAREEIGMATEGLPNTRSLYELCKKNKINAPLLSETYQVLYQNKNPRDSMRSLLAREAKAEFV